MDRQDKENDSSNKLLFEDPVVDLQTCKLISQGAEAVRNFYITSQLFDAFLGAKSRNTHVHDIGVCTVQRIWQGVYLGRPAIVKQRFNKKYRHAILDRKLTLSRLKQASLCMSHAAHASHAFL